MIPSLLNRLHQQTDVLPYLLHDLSDEQVRQQPIAGKWSIFENLAHLGRYQDVFLERMKRILNEEGPAFSRYVADEDPGFTVWTRLSMPALLNQLQESRAILQTFLSGLDTADWERLGHHPVYGPMTVEGWTEFFLLHEAHHYFTSLKLAGPLRM